MKRRLVPASVMALFALTLGVSARVAFADEPTERASRHRGPFLAADAEAEPQRGGRGGANIVGWMPDGSAYLVYANSEGAGLQLMAVEPRTGKSTPLYDAAKMQASFAAVSGVPDSEQRGAVRPSLFNEAHTAGLLVSGSDLYLMRFATNDVVRLTMSPNEGKSEFSFSPDGNRVAFVRSTAKTPDTDGDLCFVEVKAPKTEHVLAHPTGNTRVATLDWVYQEEVFDRATGHDGYSWSPDSRHIAFLQLDDAPIKPYTIPDNLPRIPDFEAEQYPLAGEANPIATIGIVDTESAKPTLRYVDLSRYPAEDRIVARIGWAPDSSHVVYQEENRVQSVLNLDSADASTRTAPTTLIHETNPGWIDILGPPTWLKDGSFLWLSDRSGHRQVLHVAATGKIIATLPTGDADVRTLHGIDAANRFVYYTARGVTNADTAAYRIALDATTPPVAITGRNGEHQTNTDPACHFVVDRYSDIKTPPQTDLLAADTGAKIKALSAAIPPPSTPSPFVPKMVEVTARDGKHLSAMIVRPANFDPTKKYPVFYSIYSGPNTPTVENRWGSGLGVLNLQLLQQGYILWFCDNRSSRDTPADAWPIRKRLGECELRDIEDGIGYLKTLPYIDSKRIGISGWSYGGFMTEYALTHSKSFKIGIAGAGVADWRLYDTIYTERYMDTPAANPDGYRDTSPVTAAADTSGRLLIVHGMMDDNVHMQNSISLIYALERADIPFDMMLYPSRSSRHGIGDRALNRHMQEEMFDFIKKNL